MKFLVFLEKSRNLSGLIYIDSFCSRYFRQSRHYHDVAGVDYHEPCAGGRPDIADGDGEVLRLAKLRRVVGQGVLRLGNTHGNSVQTEILDLLERLCSLGREVHAVCAVDLLCDDVQLLATVDDLICPSPTLPSQTDVVDHDALHSVQLLLHTGGRVRIRIVPLRLSITPPSNEHHQLADRGGELRHGKGLSRLGAIATHH